MMPLKILPGLYNKKPISFTKYAHFHNIGVMFLSSTGMPFHSLAI